MTGIWSTFELSEVFNVTDFFTCNNGGDTTEMAKSSGANKPPKRRSLYLPSDGEGTDKGKTTGNKASIEDNLILNRYAERIRSSAGTAISEKDLEDSNIGCRDDTETPVDISSASRTKTQCKGDLGTYSDIQSTCKSGESENDTLQERRKLEPSNQDVIVVVRRDAKNNTMAINFETRSIR